MATLFFSKVLVSNVVFSIAKCRSIGNFYKWGFRQTLKRFCSTKPLSIVGAIGHKKHGKTTLTCAISKVFEKDERMRNFVHTDCPGHKEFVKNMVLGVPRMDGAILVVSATEGIMSQTKDHIQLVKHAGVKDIIVFVNKADLVDRDTLVEMELKVKELLKETGFNEHVIPLITGSALSALNDQNPSLGEESIAELIRVLNERVPLPKRHQEVPFMMPIDTFFVVPGKGTCVVGKILKGRAMKGDQIQLVGAHGEIEACASDIQMFGESVGGAIEGDRVGILLQGIRKEYVSCSEFIRSPNLSEEGALSRTNCFLARVYIRRRSEGGRINLVKNDHTTMMYINNKTIECKVNLFQEDYLDPHNSHLLEELGLPKLFNSASAPGRDANKCNDVVFGRPGDVMHAKIYTRLPMLLREGQRISLGGSMTGLVFRVLEERGDLPLRWYDRNPRKKKKKHKDTPEGE